MKKALFIIVVAVAILLAGSSVAITSYVHSGVYTDSNLPKRIIINGVDCSGLSYDEAEIKLTESRNNQHIQVIGKLGETLADYTDFGCSYDIRPQLMSIKKDNKISAALSHYLHVPMSANIAMKVKKCDSDFAEQVTSSDFLAQGGIIETKDAYVNLDNTDFPIVPEVYGNKIDKKSYLEDIKQAIATGQLKFQFDENSYMTVPNIKSDNPNLLKYQKFCQKYLKQKISYEFGDDKLTLSPKDLDGLMNDDLSGLADEDKVADFVTRLKEKYDISDSKLLFTSLSGKKFKVGVGDHGWVIDPEGETIQLKSDIDSHRNVSREPVYSQRGVGKYSRTLDVGNTYIDVDISEQHVYYFENGVKKLEMDCVTGCWAAGHNTPTGVYDIKSKSRGVTLTSGGKKKDPGYYESYVSYWMPFLGNNYGLHDASWRSKFGGEIYKYSGSHGCVNLPSKKAAKLYNMISVGTVVIIHN